MVAAVVAVAEAVGVSAGSVAQEAGPPPAVGAEEVVVARVGARAAEPPLAAAAAEVVVVARVGALAVWTAEVAATPLCHPAS